MKDQPTEKDHDKVEWLNSLMDSENRWECWRAKHEHTDTFGLIIEKDEYYWFRRTGYSFHEVVRLSLRSMKGLLFSLMEGNDDLQIELKKKAEKRKQDLFDEVRGLLPRVNCE